ncbi:MAG TPA: S-methyl-5-thioribose-1-phosphate isomerase [Terriglobia bacterium]|nr:S-methyl-5-thioribose-1-phosphate isomerase [Terriglobia bacterium]
MSFKTIEWTDDGVVMIDQRKLPTIEEYPVFKTYEEVAQAIRVMVVRGAPAIGVAAAMGVALGVRDSKAQTIAELHEDFKNIANTLAGTRPTAVNLFWAIERMKRCFKEIATDNADKRAIAGRLISEALAIQAEDIESNKRMGRFGQSLLPDTGTILTHCNAGALATAGYGTALGVIRAAIENGKNLRVLADETRPFLQGARLTAWELWKDDIDVRVISDNMAGSFMRQGLVDAVIVGADRIAANGDVANKIGTYSVAVLAKQHDIPFYVAAPFSTLDLNIPDGSHIPIEERDPSEVTHIGGVRMVPDGVNVFNPAFDVTPHQFVAAIITDRGVAQPPYTQSLAKLKDV